MITGDEGGEGALRLRMVEYKIRAGDGDVGHDGARDDVAEVDEAGEAWGAPLVVAGAVLVSAGLVGAGTGAVLFAVGDE